MLLTDVVYASAVREFGQKQTSSKTEASNAEPQSVFDEPSDVLNLSSNDRFKDAYKEYSKNLSGLRPEKKTSKKSSGVDDHSGRLTRMLVSAKSREEVHAVLSEAYKNLGEAIQAAAGGDKDAAEIVRRLNKLIRRANRKIRDLSKESDIKQREKRAERQKHEQLEKLLERELKQKLAERKKREKQYLRDAYTKGKNSNDCYKYLTQTISDARIKMIARQMACSSISPHIAQANNGFESAKVSGESTTNEATPDD